MRTSLTKLYDGNSVGRDARQLLLNPHHHLDVATQLCQIQLGIISVYQPNLFKQQIVTTVFSSLPSAPLGTSSP